MDELTQPIEEMQASANSSPVPTADQTAVNREKNFPLCPHCSQDVEHIKYLDYGDIRVVFHAEMGCVLGVLPIKKLKKTI